MLKILVAEDDVSTNKLLCAILKINGYEAIPAFNGEAALDIIDHQHIDLLLCDVMMPKMDGFALTQAIRDGGQHDAHPDADGQGPARGQAHRFSGGYGRLYDQAAG